MSDAELKLRNYETTIRRRLQFEEKAFQIVNKLIDGCVDESYLAECGKLISREHYNDIVEERAISHLCGYPICDKTLKDIPKKKYHVSTRTNKVYDISERKNFCSNQCLAASKLFCGQISESPVWAREKEPAATIELRPLNHIRGVVGDEVIGISPKKLLEEEVSNLSEASDTPSKLSALDEGNKASPGNVAKSKTKNLLSEKKQGTTSDPSSRGQIKTSISGDNIEAGSRNTTKVTSKGISGSVIHDMKVDENNEAVGVLAASFVEDKTGSLNGNISNTVLREPGRNATAGNVSMISDPENVCRKEGDDAEKTVLSSELLDEKLHSSYHRENSNSAFVQSRNFCALKKHEHNTTEKELNVSSEQYRGQPESEQSQKLKLLMTLMSKKKNVLSGMADLQSVVLPVTARENVDEFKAKRNSVEKGKCGGEHIVGQDSRSLNMKHEKSITSSTPNRTMISVRAAGSVPKSPLVRVASVLKTWITNETITFLQSSLASSGTNDTSLSFSDPKVQAGYADLCKRLDAQHIEFDNMISNSVDDGCSQISSNKSLKPIPDYAALKKETSSFQLRVTEFLTGKRVKDTSQEVKDVAEEQIYMPSIDCFDQLQIRIKIVLDCLDKSIPELLTPLNLCMQDVSTIIRELAYTFRLEKDNIVFKPSEWTLVAIFILKMLCEKSERIASSFETDTSSRFFTTLLRGIGHSLKDVDVIVQDILQPDKNTILAQEI